MLMKGGLVVGKKRKIESSDVLRRISELAYGRANDAVKLVLLEKEHSDLIDDLDLSLLSEVKKGSNGVIEVKLIDRLEALELLAKLLGPSENEHSKNAESLFRALDETAGRLADKS